MCVKKVSGIRSANKAKKDMFMALTSAGVGPGVNMESHSDVAKEAILQVVDTGG